MPGPNLARMAWRNIWRNRRRTLVTLSSIAFGVLLAVLFTGLGDSGYSNMIDLAARMGGGHVSLQHPEQLLAPSLKRTVVDADALAEKVRSDAGVKRAVTRITGQTLLATARQSQGAVFLAFDPKVEDASTLAVMKGKMEGKNFASANSKGIILGKKLAHNLGVKLGRKVVYTMTDKNGEMISGLARVTAIVSTGAPSVDASLCLLPLDTVRKALSYGSGEATQVAVFIDDQRKSDEVAARLGNLTEAAAVPWHVSMPELAGFITMKVSGTVFMEMIIMLLIAAGIFNTLFMSVMERLREFGVLLAIGFSPGRLFRLVMLESLWLALVGLFASAMVTAAPYYFANTKGFDLSAMWGKAGGVEVAGVALEPIWYVDIYPENALLIAAFAIGATLLAGLFPAWRAARVAPVDAIKLV